MDFAAFRESRSPCTLKALRCRSFFLIYQRIALFVSGEETPP